MPHDQPIWSVRGILMHLHQSRCSAHQACVRHVFGAWLLALRACFHTLTITLPQTHQQLTMHRYQPKRPPGPLFYKGKYEKTTRGYVQKIQYFTPDALLHSQSAPAQPSQEARFNQNVDEMLIDEFDVPFHQRTSGKAGGSLCLCIFPTFAYQ